MRDICRIILVLTITISCKNGGHEKNIGSKKTEYEKTTNEHYELSKPTKNINAVLTLFGGYPEKADDIKREFKVLEIAKENDVAVLFMNYNQKLWLEQNEKIQLTEHLISIFEKNKLPTDNIYIGGFSSGGNVALLIGDFIIKNTHYSITPNGIFIVDSPVDLASLYLSAEKNVKQNFSEASIQESTWLIETLGKQFGNPSNNISKYQEYSVFTLQTGSIGNLEHLRKTKIRFYTEPDTLWWKKNRMVDFKQTNAYHIKRLSETLNKQNFRSIEYISTENQGYRANGERHPHSWSIVDETDLIRWILKK